MSVYFFFSGRTRPTRRRVFVKTAAEDFPSCRTAFRQKIEGLSLKGLPRIPSLSVRDMSQHEMRLPVVDCTRRAGIQWNEAIAARET